MKYDGEGVLVTNKFFLRGISAELKEGCLGSNEADDGVVSGWSLPGARPPPPRP